MVTRQRRPQGFDESQQVARRGGNVAGVDLFAAYSNERVYVAFGSQKIVLRASDTIDAARTVAGYLGVQIPNISLDAAGMTALTKNVAMQETDTGMTIRLNDPMISGTVLLTDPDALRLTRADVALNLGGAVAEIGLERFKNGETIHYSKLVPEYVRLSQAEQERLRQQGKGAK